MNTPALEQLMGAYFHQDWYDEFGDEWEAVDAFVAGSPSHVNNLLAEIQNLLSNADSETALEAYLDSLGCEYTPTAEQGGYRGWLSEIARRVAAATD